MSRRKPQSPLTAIIEFFMAAPIAQAQSGLEAAQAVVAARVRTAAPLTAHIPTTASRQRALRSDAGKPRAAAPAAAAASAPAATAAPTTAARRRRPPVNTAPVATAQANELPDSYAPPEDEA